jgi:hypothetical protein
MLVVADTVPARAVIAALPTSTPSTRPSASATATVGDALVQVIAGSTIGALNWSKPVTVVVMRSPERTEAALTAIESRDSAGAGVTAMGTEAEMPDAVAVAVMVAFPGATPRTCPPPSTLATAALLENHDTVPVAIGCPC